MAADPKFLCKRLAALKGLRAPHETVWRDCLLKTFPIRANGFGSTITDANTAQSKQARLLDGTGTDGARILASAIQSGSTPANSLWFQMYQGDSDDEGEVWLDESSHTLWQNIHAGNFDAAAFEGAKDLVGAGWFVFYIDEAPEGGFQFEPWPISQCYISASREGGPIDTVFREYELTAEQCVNKFGIDAVSKETAKLVTGDGAAGKAKPDTKVKLMRAIYPRADGDPMALRAELLPIASCTVEVKAMHTVRESGYHEMPVVVPRWAMIPDSHYAVGPAFDALPDMNMLNETKTMELASMDLALCGMWIAEDDGVLNPRTVKVGPRKIIVANSVDSMKPLETGADFNVAFTAEERLQANIRKMFMADQLAPADAPGDTTAYEVHVRVNLIRQLLGPIYGRLQPEWLKPFVERCFGIAYRAGVFKPAPRSIAGRVVSIKYLSPLARAQSLEEVSAMDQFESVLMNEAEVNPELLDNYDWDEAVRTRGKLLGVPARLIPTREAVEQKRADREEAQKAAQEEALKAEMAVKAAPQLVEQAAAA